MEEAETNLVQLRSVIIRQMDEQLADSMKRDLLLQLTFRWLYTFPLSTIRLRVYFHINTSVIKLLSMD